MDLQYVLDYEQADAEPKFKKEISKPIKMEGNDVYITDYQSVSVVAYDTNDLNKIWKKSTNDMRIFSFNGVEVDPVGEELSFEGEGLTKDEAILKAFDKIGDLTGRIVGTERFNDASLYDQEAKNLHLSDVSLNYNLVIDHYEVTNVETDENGKYKVELKVVMGKAKTQENK